MDIAVRMWIHGRHGTYGPPPSRAPDHAAGPARPCPRSAAASRAPRCAPSSASRTRWGLDVEAQRALLGWPSRSAFYNWRGGPATLPYDTLVRLSLVLGIYKALHVLYPDDEFADGWVRMREH